MGMGFQVSGPDVVYESFGGDLVVLNLATGQYFGLNPSGAELWTAITEGHRPRELGATPEESQMAEAFAAELQALGLIVPSEAAVPATRQPIAISEPPSIEVYDDLSDLIVADPIHDTDAEAGWPKMPENVG